MVTKSNPINSMVCILDEYESLEKFLLECGHSKNRMKNYFSKKYLRKGLRKRDVVDLPLDFLNLNIINPVYTGEEIEIISESNEFIVLDKPYNKHGHALKYSETESILNFLRNRYKISTLTSVEQVEKGLLYRLDYVTSGVLIYCKNLSSWKTLRENFQTLVNKKSYYAIVNGEFDKNGEITHFLKGSQRDGHKIIESDDGVEVCAKFKCLKYDRERDISLVNIDLKTGFRHQIRAQLSFLGFPILGDSLYGGLEANRVYLHAHYYSLSLNAEEYNFKSIPDGLFKDLLNLNC